MNYPNRIIAKGESDKKIVNAIQTKLKTLGYYQANIDGDYGNKTIQAVKNFQIQHFDSIGNPLIPDGKIGSITWSVLFGSSIIVETITNPLLKKTIEIAKTQIGISERGGNNYGPEVKKYLASVGLDQGNPWCMAFVFWCFKEAANQLNKTNPLLKTASTRFHWDNATCKKIKVADAIDNPSLIKPGNVFIFKTNLGKYTGHTGIVTKVENLYIHTIEGNTNSGLSSEGDGVYAVKRKINTINLGFLDYL
jgi:CHAP domain/Putative peptidoglycan binding domain